MFLKLNDLLSQVNEEEEDEQEGQDDFFPKEMVNPIINPPIVEVNIPILNEPMVNVFPMEIQDNELVNGDEIQQ